MPFEHVESKIAAMIPSLNKAALFENFLLFQGDRLHFSFKITRASTMEGPS
jgi:hypothetical protein